MTVSTEQKQSWKPLIAIALSMVMMYITSFSVNVLISAIVTDLGTTVATLQAVIVAASLIAGSLMVTAGRLGDKLGRKKVFLTGVLIYIVGLLTVVLSPNTAVFAIGWGVIWPSGMVLIIPTSIALIMHFYQGAQRALAFGIYGAVLSAVSAIAPVVVGALADAFDWRLALSLSPLAGLATLAVAVSIPETDKDPSIRIDLPSVLLSFLGFGLFLIGTTLAGHYGWLQAKRPLVVGGQEIGIGGLSIVPIVYVAAAVLLLLFLRRGSRLKQLGQTPLLDGALLRNVPFAIGMAISSLFFLVNAGTLFGISVFLQAGVRFDALQTALTTLPFTAVLAVVSFSTPGLANKIPAKWLVVSGFLLVILGLWLTAADASMDMSPTDLLIAMIVLGAGAGLIMAQATAITMQSVPPELSGGASGLSETMKEIVGQGFAIALAGSVLFGAVYASMVDSYADLEGSQLTPAEHQEIVIELEDTFQSITEEEEAAFVAELPEATRAAYGEVVEKASMAGLSSTLRVMGIVSAICLVLAVLLPGGRPSRAESGS
jgi:MFS family permease